MFWDVYLGRKCIDSVWFTADCDAEYVRDTLIYHDGYPAEILVYKS